MIEALFIGRIVSADDAEQYLLQLASKVVAVTMEQIIEQIIKRICINPLREVVEDLCRVDVADFFIGDAQGVAVAAGGGCCCGSQVAGQQEDRVQGTLVAPDIFVDDAFVQRNLYRAAIQERLQRLNPLRVCPLKQCAQDAVTRGIDPVIAEAIIAEKVDDRPRIVDFQNGSRRTSFGFQLGGPRVPDHAPFW